MEVSSKKSFIIIYELQAIVGWKRQPYRQIATVPTNLEWHSARVMPYKRQQIIENWLAVLTSIALVSKMTSIFQAITQV